MSPRTVEPSPLPEGLIYCEDFVSADEELGLVGLLDVLDFRPVVMRGRTARRSVRHFGLEYSYQRKELVPTDPLPEPVLWLRDRCARLMERDSQDLVQVLVGRYPPGAGIGWHHDAPIFGSDIVGIWLLGHVGCAFSGGRAASAASRRWSLGPRSAYLIAGVFRWEWRRFDPGHEGPSLLDHLRTLHRRR